MINAPTAIRLLRLACLSAACALAPLSAVSQAAPSPSSSGSQFIVSKPLPMVDLPINIVLKNQSGPADLHFTVTREGSDEPIFTNTGVEMDGGIGIEFTPDETGYYLVRAERSGDESSEWTHRFPVVYRDFHFMIWPPLRPDETELRNLATSVMVVQAQRETQAVEAWRQRGSNVLGAAFVGARQIDTTKSDEENIRMLVDTWSARIGDTDGIWIDEFGGYPNETGFRKTAVMNEALRQFREKHPDAKIYLAVAGALLPELAAGMRSAGVIAQLEVYQPWITAAFGTHRFYDYIDQRIHVARHTDLIGEVDHDHAAVIFIGIDGVHGAITKPELEDSIRHIRKQAPEMPGIAFYSSRQANAWLADQGMRAFANDLVERYFVQPVLDLGAVWLKETSPQAGEENTVQVRVHNIGGMRADHVELELHVESVATGERQKAGATTIDTIGTGFTRLRDESLQGTEFRYVDIDGRGVPVFNFDGIVFRDRVIADIPWTPEAPGAYILYVTLKAQDGVTILDGISERRVTVRQ